KRNSTSPYARSRTPRGASRSRAGPGVAASSKDAASSAAPARRITRGGLTRLLPLLDDELGLEAAFSVRDAELDVLRSDTLLERQRRAAPIVAAVRAAAREERDELVLAGTHVAGVEPMHAAAMQRVDLALRVEVVRDRLAVDLELDRVEREELADVHRDEHRDLRARREQQLFLEQEQIPIEVDGELLEMLDLLVERAKLGRIARAAVGRELRQRRPVVGRDARRGRGKHHGGECRRDAAHDASDGIDVNLAEIPPGFGETFLHRLTPQDRLAFRDSIGAVQSSRSSSRSLAR